MSEINFTGTEFGQHFTLPLTWRVDGGNLTLTKDQPLNTNGPNSTVALKLQDGQTVANYGFWGIPINAGTSYELTYWVNNQNVSLFLINHCDTSRQNDWDKVKHLAAADSLLRGKGRRRNLPCAVMPYLPLESQDTTMP